MISRRTFARDWPYGGLGDPTSDRKRTFARDWNVWRIMRSNKQSKKRRESRKDPLERAMPEPPESSDERNEQLFNDLPPLATPEYISHVKSTPAANLAAPVLVRAYQQLPPGEAADATLGRLLGYNDRDGYITPLYKAAKRRLSRHDAYGVDDLVQDTISEIVDTLGGPRGAGAEKAWVSYLTQRMEDAYRKLAGRRGERR